MKNNVLSVIRCTAVLFIICVIVTAALAGTNALTKEKIAQVNAENLKATMNIVLPGCDEYVSWDAGDVECFAGFDSSDQPMGYVFLTYSSGYGGEMSVMTGIDQNGTVTGVQITACNETPGLGLKAKDDAFTSQYKGATEALTVVKGEASSEQEISALTGATITSRAVTDAVNQALDCYNTYIKEATA